MFRAVLDSDPLSLSVRCSDRAALRGFFFLEGAMRQFVTALLGATALSIACVPVAFAADMPTSPPVVYKAIPAATINWTGFYAGGSIGARWSTADWTNTSFGAGLANVNNPTSLGSASARIGAYFGYNWQIAPAWLVGLEADIASGNNNKTASPWPGSPFLASGGHDFVSAKLGLDGSVRARLGMLVVPNWLLYTTGGVAWQHIETAASCDGSGPSACGGAFSESSSTTKAGWTVGAGAETVLWNHWLGRVEYRYADFGSVANNLPLSAGVGQSFTGNIRVKTNTALLGLAYKF
jgi:outer membrane immunogenic protein